MHRFGIDNYDFVQTANKQNWKTISISVGVKQTDIETLKKIQNNNLRVDYITIDIAHGHGILMKNTIDSIENFGESVFIIAGNVATASDAVSELTEWGADAIKVGIGQEVRVLQKTKLGLLCQCLVVC